VGSDCGIPPLRKRPRKDGAPGQWLSILSGLPEARRKKRIITMIQAYVDDSGNDGRGPVFLFSALIGEAEKWATFSDEWDACLRDAPSIRYFKMDEAAGNNKEFYGFSNIERDDKVRRLCRIINGVGATEISTSLELAAFDNTWRKTAGRPLCEPYFFPFQAMNMGVAYQVGAMGVREPYEIFFDEQVIFGPRAKAWYPILRAFQVEAVRALMPVEPFFRSDHDVLPLQAADLTAWIERQKRSGGLREFEWLDSELGGLLHSELSRLIDEKWIRRFKIPPDEVSENRTQCEAAMLAYQETFGHEWPPKNKAERKKMRGR
jgi:Protein of unknown function (DUF3800)